MTSLVAVYWICFGVGLVYVLLAGALGAISHGFAGAHSGDTGSSDHDLDGHGHIESADLSSDTDNTDHSAHGQIAAADAAHDSGMPDYNPFSLMGIMGMLSGFGAGGLIAVAYGVGTLASLGIAAFGGLVMAFVLWLLIGKLLYSLHASSEAHVADMIGLEAEVLTPIEPGTSGEIAYVLDGTRFTAPARLIHGGSVGRADKVRIRRVGDNLVYVEEKRKLLS
ncbi:MAG: hypothetical protein M3R04_01485 [bacterium]|nr:hypothetical protein [bacterium]